MAQLRIVSVVPAATEIVTALGAADSLVGVSHECVLPAGLAPRPRVTASAIGMSEVPGEIDAEVAAMSGNGTPLFTLLSAEIEALRPDIIITQGLCNVCAVSEEDVRGEADRLLASLRARMKRVHEVLSAAHAPRPRVAVLEWTDPPFAAGHWVPEMVNRAGGTDVFAVAGCGLSMRASS